MQIYWKWFFFLVLGQFSSLKLVKGTEKNKFSNRRCFLFFSVIIINFFFLLLVFRPVDSIWDFVGFRLSLLYNKNKHFHPAVLWSLFATQKRLILYHCYCLIINFVLLSVYSSNNVSRREYSGSNSLLRVTLGVGILRRWGWSNNSICCPVAAADDI